MIEAWAYLWSGIGILIAVLLVAEYGPRGVRGLIRHVRFGAHGRGDPRARADCFADKDWAARHLAECHKIVQVDWAPYSGHRQRPFAGETLVLGPRGRRQTWQPPGAPEKSAVMYGGSTVIGVGAPDDGTIPSLLAKRLAESGVPVKVENAGVVSSVTAQDGLAFFESLKDGERPQLAIFYGGINDLISAGQNRVGQPYNADLRRREYGLLGRPRDLLRKTFAALFPETLKRLGVSRAPGAAAAAPGDLAAAAVDRYAETVKQIAAVARAYDVACLFVWQPVIYGKREMSAYERSQRESYPESVAELFRAAYAARRNHPMLAAREDCVDLGALLDGHTEPLFLDPFHICERGNAVVADAMLPSVRATLDSRAADSA